MRQMRMLHSSGFTLDQRIKGKKFIVYDLILTFQAALDILRQKQVYYEQTFLNVSHQK